MTIMKSISLIHNNRRGLTIIEMLMAIALTGIVFLMIQISYRALARNTLEIQDTTDMYMHLKMAFGQIKRDLANAGGGLVDGSALTAPTDAGQIAFSYMDRLEKQCGIDDSTIAKIEYQIQNDTLYRELYCDGTSTDKKNVLNSADGIAISFVYLNEEGQVTTDYSTVQVVNFTLTYTSSKTGLLDKDRQASGQIHINN